MPMLCHSSTISGLLTVFSCVDFIAYPPSTRDKSSNMVALTCCMGAMDGIAVETKNNNGAIEL